VVICEPEKDFRFTVGRPGKPWLNSWRYQLEAKDGGTDVTESFQLPDNVGTKVYWTLFGRWRGRTNREGMRTTLERMKAVLEEA
jgi:hypothetical protein